MLKTLSLLFLSILYSSIVFAVEKGPAVPDYPADKVAENVYIIHGPVTTPNPENQGFMNNPGIVMTSKGVVIVDPGGTLQSGEMVLRVLKTLTNQPVVAVFNTHVHGDHWLGNQAIVEMYPDVVIYAHPNLIERVANGAGDDWVTLMEDLSAGKSKGTSVVSANKAIQNGEKITIGQTVFEVFNYGIAHTDSDIMISVNKNAVLFMGDNLVNGRLARSSDGHINKMIESCEKVAQIQPVVIVPGHGQSGGMDMFNHSLDIFRILYKSVKQQYAEDMSDFEMKPVIVEALEAYKSWHEFDSLVGKTINQAFLEIEEADF